MTSHKSHFSYNWKLLFFDQYFPISHLPVPDNHSLIFFYESIFRFPVSRSLLLISLSDWQHCQPFLKICSCCCKRQHFFILYLNNILKNFYNISHGGCTTSTFPPTMNTFFLLLHILLTFAVTFHFDYSHSNVCVMQNDRPFGLDLYFPDD